MKDAANNTKQALDVSEKAIQKARAALKEANDNLNSTRNATAQVVITPSLFPLPEDFI